MREEGKEKEGREEEGKGRMGRRQERREKDGQDRPMINKSQTREDGLEVLCALFDPKVRQSASARAHE